MKKLLTILTAYFFASCSNPEAIQTNETIQRTHDSVPEHLIGEWASNMHPDKMVAKIEANEFYFDMSRKGFGQHRFKLSELKKSKVHYNSYELVLPNGNTITIGWNIDPNVTIIVITYTVNGVSNCVDWLIIYTPKPIKEEEPVKEEEPIKIN